MAELAIGCAESYAKAKAEAEALRVPCPLNPFPKGARSGSATSQVLDALRSAHPRWLEHWELMRITGRSRGAVTWGMRFLGERGLVRSIKSARNPQYRRYQAVVKKGV